MNRYSTFSKRILFVPLKRLLLLFVSIFLFTFCSSTKIISDTENREYLDKLNKLGSSYSSTVYLLDDNIYHCSFINVNNDSLYFISENSDSLKQIAISQLYKVTFYDIKSSLVGGAAIGVGVGLLGYLILAETSECEGCSGLVLLLEVISVPIGLVTAYLFTSNTEFIFNEKYQKN
jgi:hypothetical protein